MPDAELLELRFRDLDLHLAHTWVHDCLLQLHDELAERGLRFRPHAWLSTDWFSPVGVPGIAVPFYLAHPRLTALERRQMLEVEGGSRSECLKILRHECGHAIQQAWRIHRRKDWRRLFGNSSREYPEFYRPSPASRRFVQHLRMYYAQSHPDEDFAETFAVWLGPRRGWQKRYAGWPALKKLTFVDELMEDLAGSTAPVRSRRHILPLSELNTTLQQHYAERRERYRLDAPEIYDGDLQRLFVSAEAGRDDERAVAFLRRHRGAIRARVARFTGEYQFALDQMLADMIRRCRELDLRAGDDEGELLMDFCIVLTAHTMGSLHTHRRWLSL